VRAERGWVLLSADFSQAEPYVMAGLSGDLDYLHDLQRGDINSILAVQVYGGAYVASEGKTGGTASYLMRQRCKFAWLAWCYGAGDRKVDTLLGVHTNVTAGWRSRYPVFAAYRDRVNQEQVITLDSGARVPLWDRVWVDDTGELQQRTDRAGNLLPSRLGLNGATQGTQADLLKLSMHRLLHWGWSWAMRFFLHDELLLCVPAWMASQAAQVLKEAMTVRFRGVTINCEVTIEGRTWQPQPTGFNPDDIPDVDDDEFDVA
jgi:DNA polymerase I-like protein with 3'-5' exonuclease and polymerase domains